ncbi:hypothetical protein BH11MYX3_BH11MYX3_03670 [soil metagenome]
MRYLAGLALVAGCAGADDPCDGRSGACITVTVEAPAIDRIDQLEVDLLYDGLHTTTTTLPSQGGTSGFPLVLAIELDLSRPATVGVVAAGKLSGNVLGTGAGSLALAPATHDGLGLLLAAPDECTAGAFYCGGDKLAGDPQTLYQCNGGGVPLARGVCASQCSVRPANDDTCRGTGGCVEGGDYCGGDKLDGDPQTLYRCTGGAGTNPRLCAKGCVIRAAADDICR